MFTFSSVLVPPQWQFCDTLRNRKKNLLVYLGLSPALLFEEGCRVRRREPERKSDLHRFSGSHRILPGTPSPLVLNLRNAATLYYSSLHCGDSNHTIIFIIT